MRRMTDWVQPVLAFTIVAIFGVWLFSNAVMLYLVCSVFWVVLIGLVLRTMAYDSKLLTRIVVALRAAVANMQPNATGHPPPARQSPAPTPAPPPPSAPRQAAAQSTGSRSDRQKRLDEGIAGIEALEGLDEVRRGLEDLLETTEHTSNLRNRMRGLSQGTLFVLSGSRGTGRMTVAVCLGKILYGLGLTEDFDIMRYASDHGRGRSAGELYSSAFEGAPACYDRLLVFEDADWLMEGDAAAVGRALSDAAQRAPGRLWVVMIGSSGLGHRLKTTPEVRTAWQKAFVMRDIRFAELNDANVANILDNYIEMSETRWDNLARKRFVRSISEARSSASFANAITVRQLFEGSVQAGVTRVRSNKSMTISEADVDQAAELLAL